MSQLAMLPACASGDRRRNPPREVAIDFVAGKSATFALRLIDGALTISATACPKNADQVALLRHQPIEGGDEWYLLDSGGRFSINDQTALLGIQRLAAGDLLSCGGQSWFVTRRVIPAPIPAPESVRDRSCPLCGDKLGVAPVVQCSCGRFMHLARPGDPGDESALNCFLIAKVCGSCGQPTSLQPQLIPELPVSIGAHAGDELAADLVDY